MPIKQANTPDYACRDCGYTFRATLWKKLLAGRNSPLPPLPPPKCPKCGCRNVGLLMH